MRQPRPDRAPGPLLAAAASLAFALAMSGTPASEALARDAHDPSLDTDRQVILITGSTGGLGRETALLLGAEGHHILVHGRNAERGEEVVALIRASGGQADFYRADLASLDDVRDLARRVLDEHDRLDVLVNNAGIWLEADQGRLVNEDGYELHFQVNHLSHFLLTHLLLDRLTESAPARIVNVASTAQRPIDFDDVMMNEGYSDGRGYAQSKLAQVMFTYDLVERLAGTGVTTYALHPATMMDTGMVLDRGAQPRASVDDGTRALLQLIISPDAENGRYYNGMNAARANAQAYDEEARARLWTLSEELTGLRP
jgi:NAD(P)-dependent dehydrogenase (short-subunit alcohol dehydrogenase family)